MEATPPTHSTRAVPVPKWLAWAVSLLVIVTGMTVAAGPAAAESSPRADGVVVTPSSRSFDGTWDALMAALDANPAIGVVATIDHAAAAASAGLELEPNRIVVFGNPALGTPLMRMAQTTGIDLPQKMQVFETDGLVYVAYNAPAYVASRHALGGAPQLDLVAGALAGLAAAATGNPVDAAIQLRNVTARSGLVDVTAASNDFAEVATSLLDAIAASPASLAFRVDHHVNAANAGLELRPTSVFVFGNPNLGTPLMAEDPTIGLDLPLKILVWEDAAGSVHVTTNSALFLARRHGVTGQDGLIRTIAGAVAGLVDAAAS